MSVLLRKQNLKKGVYLSFIEAFYDPKTKNTIQKTIEKIGYVEELKKTYNDPIKYFSDKAKELSIVSSRLLLTFSSTSLPYSKSLYSLSLFISISI